MVSIAETLPTRLRAGRGPAKPLRILFWNQKFLPSMGGVEIFTARLASALVRRGHEALVVATRNPSQLPEDEMLNGIRVRRFSFLEALTRADKDSHSAFRLFRDITSAIAELKRAFRPDVIQVNLADASPLFHLRTLDAHPCPTVVTLQSALSWSEAGTGGLAATIFRQATSVVAVSSFAATNMAKFANLNPAEIDVIAPGVPVDEFAPSRGIEPAAIHPTIAFVGRLVSEKGASVAIEAVAQLGGAARLRIVGDGVERSRLQAWVGQQGWDSLVSFEGAVGDAERRRLLSKCFVMVVPSLHDELFGMVAVEGALMGLPVVASAIGGLSEIVEPDRTGFLFPAGDAAALATHLRKLLADLALARRLGDAGRAKALKHYSIEHTADRYESLYVRCLASEPASA